MSFQPVKFYQTGTFTVGNRLLPPEERSVQSQVKRYNSINSGHRACQGCGEALGARYAIDAAMIASTTKLNTPGRHLAHLDCVHALTDITGFGLLGHLLEVCRGAKLSAMLDMPRIPMLADVERLATAGYITGASARNWMAYGEDVALDAAITPMQRALLTDPQTSGGLLVACEPAAVDAVLEVFRAEDFAAATVIGRLESGPAQVRVTT